MNKGSNLPLSLPPLSGEDKRGVSFILEDKRGVSAFFSPSQGENQRGGFRSSLPLSGGDTEEVSTGGNLTPALS